MAQTGLSFNGVSVAQLSARSQSPYPEELNRPKFINRPDSPDGASILSKLSNS